MTTPRPEPEADTWSRSRHRAYLETAWRELRQHRFADAIGRIRRATPAAADHATLALFWARRVEAALAQDGAAPATDFERFLAAHPELVDPAHVHRHYSPERLDLPRARREFVLPDRAPLPAPSRRAAGTEDAGGDGRAGGTKTISRA